jgi:hypothetical protein
MLGIIKTCSKSNKAVNMNIAVGSTLRFLKACSHAFINYVITITPMMTSLTCVVSLSVTIVCILP